MGSRASYLALRPTREVNCHEVFVVDDPTQGRTPS